MKRINEDIPLEAAVKWLIRERDRYRDKLDELIVYTKSLERELKEGAEPYEHKIKSLEGDIKSLRKENAALRKDFKETEWAKGIVKENERLKLANRDLWKKVNEFNRERHDIQS